MFALLGYDYLLKGKTGSIRRRDRDDIHIQLFKIMLCKVAIVMQLEKALLPLVGSVKI